MTFERIDVTLNEFMGSDLTVVNAARVSFNKHETEMNEKNERLIQYLADHRHTSPFGHCFVSFTVKAPIFVARQLVKHKFLRINEVSRRYVDDEPSFYMPHSWRERAENVKQGSSESVVKQNFDINTKYVESMGQQIALYNELLEAKVAPEQARMVLPQSIMTEWWWSGSLDAFADMCNLRCKPDAQKETQKVAYFIDQYMEKLFPVSWRALRK